jgi:hypothetical protein
VFVDFDWVSNSPNPSDKLTDQFAPAAWNFVKKVTDSTSSDKDLNEKIAKYFPNKAVRNVTNLFMDLSNNNFEEAVNNVLGTTAMKKKKKIEQDVRKRMGKEKIFKQKNKLIK